VRVIAPDLLVYPDYDGNGMFKSLGNIRANAHVGLLFIAMERPDDPLLAQCPGGQLLVRITPTHIFHCPRYVPHMQLVGPSEYAPQAGCEPIEPAWKGFTEFRDVVPTRKSTAG